MRNVLITRMYYDLGRSMDAVLGEQDANWLTFGTWASFTAGRFIRGAGLPVRLGVSHVADGNVAIIEDIAPCFVAYLSSVAGEDGSHPLIQTGRQRIDGSPHLRDAFTCYEQARRATDLASVGSVIKDLPVTDTEHRRHRHVRPRRDQDLVDPGLGLGAQPGQVQVRPAGVGLEERGTFGDRHGGPRSVRCDDGHLWQAAARQAIGGGGIRDEQFHS